MGKINIKLLKKEDWQPLKLIRLDALNNDSDSYGSNYSSISQKLDSYWINQIADMNNKFFIAFDELAPIGLVRISLNDPETPTNFGYLGSLYVKKEYRNQGIARKLIITAEESVNDIEDVFGIYVEVYASLVIAVSLYKTLGYKIKEERCCGRKKDLVMFKHF